MSPINLNEWLTQFCEWHDSFKKGVLAAEASGVYMQARQELCGALLMAQRLAIEPGAAARGYQIEFGFPTGPVSAITSDISTSGLSALVAEAPPNGTVLWMRLKISGGAVIVGRCQVVKNLTKQGSILMCVAFEGLPADAREKIETVVCDVVVSELRASMRHRQAAVG
jgi:PilZ domain